MPANSIFLIQCQTNLILILRVLTHAKTRENKAYGFQILPFYRSFSNVIVPVKGLTIQGLIAGVWHTCTYCKAPLVA